MCYMGRRLSCHIDMMSYQYLLSSRFKSVMGARRLPCAPPLEPFSAPTHDTGPAWQMHYGPISWYCKRPEAVYISTDGVLQPINQP